MLTQSSLISIIVCLGILIGMVLTVFIIVRDRDNRQILKLKCKLDVFKANSFFMNSSEKWLYRLLKEFLLNAQFEIFAQVHMASLIGISDNAVDYYETLRDLDKSIDFVITEKETMKPLLAIELNGPDHNKNTRKIRDQFLLQIFSDCKIPFLTIDVSELNNQEKLKEKVVESIQSH